VPPNTYNMLVVPFDELFLAAILQFSHCLQCTYATVRRYTFDYFGIDYKKQSVSNLTPPGAIMYHWAPDKAWDPHLRESLAPKSIL